MPVSNYPHDGHLYSGVFNERSVRALKELGHRVEVVAPRPYVPRWAGRWSERWSVYRKISEHEIRNGISVYRPAYPQAPFIRTALWSDQIAYLCSVGECRKRHRQLPYDAILSFNLVGAGGLAWRLGRRLGIPAAGWATGNDVRVPADSSFGRAVRRALENLDLVFYQSRELLEKAARLQGRMADRIDAERHVVVPRGIECPPERSNAARAQRRAEWGLREDQTLVLYVGRIVRSKGVFELVDAVWQAKKHLPGIGCLLVGAKSGFDDGEKLAEKLRGMGAGTSIRILPECSPAHVWDYLSAADIFAFPSHNEGMPNSLLEAMAMGVPAVAYAIPAITEIDAGKGALAMVRPFEVTEFGQAILELAASRAKRTAIAAVGLEQIRTRFQAQDRMAEAAGRLSALIPAAAPFKFSGAASYHTQRP
ncbi:MAG TPA: glycosyltransferase [Terriglobales bacterium]|nr:glycosyltransferase [Terriglobales bacterium]